ncbi:MAG TPA: PqqD family protein [Promineifilum sp.]|nr:PqqD family protein [Promineifilum sp.]
MFDSIPMARAGIEAKEIGGETLLIDGDDIYVLNETAAFIWHLCDGQHSLADIEAALRQEYSVPEENDLRADITQTVEELRVKRLLEAP